MTALPDARPPMVRPGFLRWSTVAYVLLLPFVVHALWDYVETRRLHARIEAIAQKGQPITMASFIPITSAAGDADRFYRAAAALSAGYGLIDGAPVVFQVHAALRTGDVTPDALGHIRAHVAKYGEALSLADRAADLPFERFLPGYTFNHLLAGLNSVSQLCEMRATEQALAGDGDAALASLFTDVRLERAMARPPQLYGLKLTLERTRPSVAARTKLARALAEIDHDDFMKRDFMRLRAFMIDQRTLDSVPALVRPWFAHRLTEDLDVFAALVAAAEQPEAGRLSAVMAVNDWPLVGFSSAQRRVLLESHMKSLVKTAERIRCARRLVAGEMVNCQL